MLPAHVYRVRQTVRPPAEEYSFIFQQAYTARVTQDCRAEVKLHRLHHQGWVPPPIHPISIHWIKHTKFGRANGHARVLPQAATSSRVQRRTTTDLVDLPCRRNPMITLQWQTAASDCRRVSYRLTVVILNTKYDDHKQFCLVHDVIWTWSVYLWKCSLGPDWPQCSIWSTDRQRPVSTSDQWRHQLWRTGDVPPWSLHTYRQFLFTSNSSGQCETASEHQTLKSPCRTSY